MSDTTLETNIFNASNIKIQSSKIINDFHNLGYGTATEVLTSLTPGSPTIGYAVDGSAGSIIFLATGTASNVATLDFNQYLNSNYDNYLVTVENMLAGNSTANLLCLAGTGKSPDYLVSAYAGVFQNWYNGGPSRGTNATTSFGIAVSIPATVEVLSGHIMFFNTQNPTSYKSMMCTTFYKSTGAVWTTSISNGRQTGDTAWTSLRFQMSSGNILQGTFKLYGYKN